MSLELLPQIACIEQPFGCAPPIVHCPICGKASMEIVDECGTVTPCPHLAFIYVGEIGDFEFQSADCEKRFEEVDMDELDFDSFSKVLKSVGYDNKLLAIQITYGGMACGPTWYTDIFAFDYSTATPFNNY